jgi:hypothetical protein
MSSNVELAKPRDFGEIINDTFTFMKQNLKPLLRYFFIFCGIFVVGGILSSSMLQLKIANTTNAVSTASYNLQYKPSIWNYFGIEYFLSIVFTMLSVITVQVTTLSYIALYKEKDKQPPTTEEMWGYIKYYYLKILGSSILLYLLLTVATLACIIPGIYLLPIFALILPVMVIENTSFGYAFSRAFVLIKENWWTTFGSLVVIWIIVYVCMVVVTLPASLINMVSLLLHPQSSRIYSVPAAMITAAIQHLCQVFAIIPCITLSLCYFNLTESKDGTSLMDKINKLGTTSPDTDLPVEEY